MWQSASPLVGPSVSAESQLVISCPQVSDKTELERRAKNSGVPVKQWVNKETDLKNISGYELWESNCINRYKLQYCPGNYIEGLRKTTKILSQGKAKYTLQTKIWTRDLLNKNECRPFDCDDISESEKKGNKRKDDEIRNATEHTEFRSVDF